VNTLAFLLKAQLVLMQPSLIIIMDPVEWPLYLLHLADTLFPPSLPLRVITHYLVVFRLALVMLTFNMLTERILDYVLNISLDFVNSIIV